MEYGVTPLCPQLNVLVSVLLLSSEPGEQDGEPTAATLDFIFDAVNTSWN